MQALFIVILVVHVLLSVLLIIVVLVQQRTKGGIAGVFGGGGGLGGAEQIFGSPGVAPFLTRITSILGAAFLVTSLVLVLISGTLARGVAPVVVPSGQPQETQTGAPIPQPGGQTQPVQPEGGVPVLPQTPSPGGQ